MTAPGHRTYLNIGKPDRGRFYMPEAKRTPTQSERARGEILPMPQPKRSLFDWIWR